MAHRDSSLVCRNCDVKFKTVPECLEHTCTGIRTIHDSILITKSKLRNYELMELFIKLFCQDDFDSFTANDFLVDDCSEDNTPEDEDILDIFLREMTVIDEKESLRMDHRLYFEFSKWYKDNYPSKNVPTEDAALDLFLNHPHVNDYAFKYHRLKNSLRDDSTDYGPHVEAIVTRFVDEELEKDDSGEIDFDFFYSELVDWHSGMIPSRNDVRSVMTDKYNMSNDVISGYRLEVL